MGAFIGERIGRPEAIVSSDAHRARQTAELAAEAMGFDAPIVFDRAVYDAGPGDLIEVVQSLPEAAAAALLVGHNPGMETLVAFLAGSEVRLPTAGLAHLTLDIEHWADAGARSGRLLASYTPKELHS